MPVRRTGEPQIFPGATVPKDEAVIEEQAHVYLTDSTEIGRVRAPLAVGSSIEIRCLFTARPLAPGEEQALRVMGKVWDGVSVSPTRVECTVTAPGGILIHPNVSVGDGGVYVAEIVVGRAGGWHYEFTGRGGWTGTRRRAFDIT